MPWLIIRSAAAPGYTITEIPGRGMTYEAAQREIDRINGLILAAQAALDDTLAGEEGPAGLTNDTIEWLQRLLKS